MPPMVLKGLGKALEEYLKEEIFPLLAPGPYGPIEVKPLAKEKPVYLFREKRGNLEVVGKFFQWGEIDATTATRRMEREYQNLLTLVRLGMDRGKYRVSRPLGRNPRLRGGLFTEKALGKDLDHYLEKAILQGKEKEFKKKVKALARWLARLHGKTEKKEPSHLLLAQQYLEKLLASLKQGEALDPKMEFSIRKHAGRWRQCRPPEDGKVLVHGDATPTNFFFFGDTVTAIDLERTKEADRCWDLGFMAAELKHYYLWKGGHRWQAEPFIRSLLKTYCRTLETADMWIRVTKKLPFYMALGLLRIARNPWLHEEYRETIIREAKECLKYGL